MNFNDRLKKLPGKPDIIIIITDQERATQHFPEHWESKNLKSLTFLKENGFTFERAFCNTCMCTPSRATLFTGTYPAQHKATQTLTDGGRFSPAEMTLSNTYPNMARMLIDDGYDVQYRGKWHLSKSADGQKPDAADIALFGFKGWIGPDAGEDAKPENFGGGFANHDKAYVRQSVDFLRDVRKRRSEEGNDPRPYCLIVSLVNPHDVLSYPKGFKYGYNDQFLKGDIELPATVDEDLADNKKPAAQAQTKVTAGILLGALNSREKQRNYINFYGNTLRWVDAEIGHFLEELYREVDGNRLADQALVIRTADHGEMGMAHGGMRQKAFVAYEEALRIPMVFSNPIIFDKKHPYKSTSNLASLVDIMPTIAAITGAVAPDGLRGVNLLPLLEKDEPVQEAILFTFDDTKAGAPSRPVVVKAASRIRCVRTPEWKFTRYFDALGGYPDEFELYHLSPDKDPLEYKNLAYNPEFAETRKKMEALLHHLESQKLYLKPEKFDEQEFREWYAATEPENSRQ